MKKDTYKHLGGHSNLTHIDIGALRFLIEDTNAKTMLDVGCGPGGMLKAAINEGLNPTGIDGFPGDNQESGVKIIIHDFAQGSYPHSEQTFDLGWSCEFVEHVEEKYLENYMHSFSRCETVAITFAPPGTPGHHHVNCRDQSYWIEIFERNGFSFDEDGTKQLRTVSTMKRDFVRKHGLLFRKNS